MNAFEHILSKLTQWLPQSLVEPEFLGNTPVEWIAAGVWGLCIAIFARLVKVFAVRRLRRLASLSTTRADDIIVDTLDRTHVSLYFAVGLYAGSLAIDTNAQVRHVLNLAIVVTLLVQTGIWGQTLFRLAAQRWSEKRDGNQSNTVAAGLTFIARLAIWSVVLLLILANLGIEVGALIAGLGIGGVAAALALQNVLGDVFASLSMYFDRPFDIGDLVRVNEILGSVESIGTRTTRIKSLSGEQIVVPNGDLAKSRIRNYARMQERRVVFEFGIEYNLPAEKVERAAQIAKEVVERTEGVRFDRAHFKSYGAYSLDFEVVYYVLSRDYSEYMSKQHEINLGVYREFEDAGIAFAFPTQTLYHRNESGADGHETQRHSVSGRRSLSSN